MKAEYDFSKAKRGAVKSPAGKTRITIYLDDDLLEHFREAATLEGLGYQTVINRTLRAAMTDSHASATHEALDVSALLVEIREVLKEVKHRLPEPVESHARDKRNLPVNELIARARARARTNAVKRALHIAPHSGGWAVKVEGRQRAASVHGSKQDALDAARKLARKDVLELVIHGRDGKIQDRESYGSDSHLSGGEKHSRNK